MISLGTLEQTGIAAPAVERALLGTLLVFKEAALAQVGDLQAADFAEELRPGLSHADIYATILDDAERGRPWDALTIGARLPGAAEYLCELASQAATDADVAHYVAILQARTRKRAALHALDLARRRLLAAEESDLDRAVADAQDVLSGLEVAPDREGLRPITEDIGSTLQAAQEIAARGGGLAGLATGFCDLDRISAGLQRGQLIILAARTSQGKTALGMQISAHVAGDGRNVAVFSLEMDRRRLTARLLANVARLPVLEVITGHADRAKVETAAEQVRKIGTRLLLDCRAGLSAADIRAALRRLKVPADLVVVDYLQLMRSAGRPENRQTEVSAISRALKGLAITLDVPVLALSQFSRQADLGGRPQLSWLRESGSIEQDADIVLALHNEQPRVDDRACEIELIALKNRCGPCRALSLWWEPACVRFANFSHAEA